MPQIHIVLGSESVAKLDACASLLNLTREQMLKQAINEAARRILQGKKPPALSGHQGEMGDGLFSGKI